MKKGQKKKVNIVMEFGRRILAIIENKGLFLWFFALIITVLICFSFALLIGTLTPWPGTFALYFGFIFSVIVVYNQLYQLFGQKKNYKEVKKLKWEK